jgi:DNA-binding SARP family transcriptional activator/streptogramin lyase
VRGCPFNARTIAFHAAVRSVPAVLVGTLRILLLGPVELWVGERRAVLGGPKQRAMLALLALDPGQTVSRDRAVEALWGDSDPESHARRLHTVVSRLRTALREAGGSADVLDTTKTGYRLRIDPGQVDAVRAAQALRQVRDLRSVGRQDEASAVARDALSLWHGPPLADLLDNGWAGDDLRRLEDLKLSLLEDEFESRLALGPSPGLADELAAACASAPLRERLHASLILALNASGRRADALHEYDRIRRRLSEELGITPGAVLREAHQIVVAGAPDATSTPTAPSRRPFPRPTLRTVAIGAVAVAVVAATAAALLAREGRRGVGAVRLPAGSLVIASSDLGHLRADIPLSGTVINEQPGGLVLAGSSLWSVTEKGTVTQVDLIRGRVVGSTPLALPAGPGGMTVGLGATWVTDSGSPTLYQLGSGITAARRIRLPPLEGTLAGGTGGVTVAAGSVWVAREGGAVDRLSRDGRLEHRFRIPAARQLVGDDHAIWVISSSGVVTRLDPRNDAIRSRTNLRPDVCCMALGGGSAWATSETGGLLWELGPDGGIQDVVHIPAPATELAYADGAVWISGFTSGKVTRVDAQSLAVRVISTDQPIAGMAAAPGTVAFSTFPSERVALAGVRGPIARILMAHDLISDTDPVVPAIHGDRDADLQRLDLTCLSLYDRMGGGLTPYAASAPAERSSNERVWTFRIRSGFAFSPPSGEPVDAGTFAATIERATAPVLAQSEAAKLLADVAGMSAYRRGLTTHIAGVEAAGARLTIRLQSPIADLDARLSEPYFCAVPKDTPAVPTGLQDPIPSAGPYYIAGSSGGAFTVLRRNPHYSRPSRGKFEAFVYNFDVDPRRALEAIRRGQADYAAFYDDEIAASLATQLSSNGDVGVRSRLSSRAGPGDVAANRSQLVEFFGRRLGCRSYSRLYAGLT